MALIAEDCGVKRRGTAILQFAALSSAFGPTKPCASWWTALLKYWMWTICNMCWYDSISIRHLRLFSYSTNNFQKTTTVSTGQTNSGGTGILEGTKTVTVVGWQGEMISRIVYDITNGVDGVTLSSESYT